MPAIKSAPSLEQFVNDVKNLMLESAARASAVFTSAKFQTDTFKDATGINSGTSSGYTHRGTPNFDLILQTSGTVIAQQTSKVGGAAELHSNPGSWGAGGLWENTSGVNKTIARITLNLARQGSPTGNYKLNVYSVNGSNLPDTLLSSSIPVSNRAEVGTSQTDYDFDLETPQVVPNGGKIIFMFEYDGAQTGDGSNYIRIYGKGSSGTTFSGIRKNTSNVYTSGGDELYAILREAAPASADIRAITLTVPAAVTQVVMCADVTLNSGTATYYVSTDGGTNWTTVSADDLKRIISVPSGTQLVPRVVLTGDAELEFLSIAAAA